MSSVEILIESARALGAQFTVDGQRVTVVAPSPLPGDLMAMLRDKKIEVASYLTNQTVDCSFECWALEEWRRTSIPDWRRILRESIQRRDQRREGYARWMLSEVLLDEDYIGPA